jgi:hypothetical protein
LRRDRGGDVARAATGVEVGEGCDPRPASFRITGGGCDVWREQMRFVDGDQDRVGSVLTW